MDQSLLFRKISLFSLVLLLLIGTVSAGVYSPMFDPVNDTVHYNTSTTFASEASTPDWMWIDTTILGIGLFLLSLIITLDQCSDIVAMLAVLPLGMSIWESLSIDIISSYGTAGLQVGNQSTWVLMENHLIYHPEPITVMMIIFFLISIINCIRIKSQGGFKFLQKNPSEKGETD